MTCERAAEIIDAWIDGELDPLMAREMEWHVQECMACGRQVAARKAVQRAVQMHVPRHRAPEELRSIMMPERVVRKNPWRVATFALAACLVVAIGAMAWWSLANGKDGSEEMMARCVVNSHLRALQLGTDAGRMVDIASTDRHTVKPWFAGRLPFAPVVRDLKDQGFPLVGGRLEMIDRQPAAGLVYMRDKHVISLIMRPTTEKDESARLEPASVGYHLVYWVQGGMECWCISDLEEGQLMAFARAFEESASGGAGGGGGGISPAR